MPHPCFDLLGDTVESAIAYLSRYPNNSSNRNRECPLAQFLKEHSIFNSFGVFTSLGDQGLCGQERQGGGLSTTKFKDDPYFFDKIANYFDTAYWKEHHNNA